MSDQPLDLAALAEAFQELSRFAMEHAPPRRSVSRQLIEDHLQVDPGVLPVVGDEHSIVERPNLQLALDAWAIPAH